MILHQIFIVSTNLSVCESVLCLLVEPNSCWVTSARQCGSASRYLPCKLLNFGRFTWLSSATHDFQTVWSLQLLCVPRVTKNRSQILMRTIKTYQNTSSWRNSRPVDKACTKFGHPHVCANTRKSNCPWWIQAMNLNRECFPKSVSFLFTLFNFGPMQMIFFQMNSPTNVQ